MPTNWLVNLVGIKDVVDGTGAEDVTLNRRGLLRFSGAGFVVTDDPSKGASNVEFNPELLTLQLTPKPDVVTVATANVVALSSLALTINGVAVNQDGMRVLLTAQSTASQNGIWVAHGGSWTRPVDFDTGDAASGAFVFVERGSTYEGTGWVCTTDSGVDEIDSDALAFRRFSPTEAEQTFLSGSLPADPGDDNRVAVASGGLLTYLAAAAVALTVSVSEYTPDSNTIGGHLTGIDAEIGSIYAAIAAVDTTLQPPTDPGEDLRVAYGQSGDLAYTPGLVLAAGGATIAHAAFGADPAATGAVRLSNTNSVNAKATGGADVSLLQLDSGDTVIVGSNTAGAALRLRSAASIELWAVGSRRGGVSSLGVFLDDAHSLRVGLTNIATAGDQRVRHPFTLQGRDSGAANNANLLRWGGVANDYLTIGEGTRVTNTQINASTNVVLLVGDVEKLIVQSTQILPQTTVAFGSQVATFGADPAASGQVRTTHNSTFLSGKGFGGTTAALVRWGAVANDRLTLGQDTIVDRVELRGVTSLDFNLGGTRISSFDVSGQFLTDGLNLRLGQTAVAGAGDIRGRHPFSILARDSGNSGNANVLRWGAVTNTVTLGGDTLVAGAEHRVASGGSHSFYVNNAVRLVIQDTQLQFNFASVRYLSGIGSPTFTQNDVSTNGTNGQRLTVRAQSALGTNGTEIGGPLRLQSGDAPSGLEAGIMDFYLGAQEIMRLFDDEGDLKFGIFSQVGTPVEQQTVNRGVLSELEDAMAAFGWIDIIEA